MSHGSDFSMPCWLPVPILSVSFFNMGVPGQNCLVWWVGKLSHSPDQGPCLQVCVRPQYHDC